MCKDEKIVELVKRTGRDDSGFIRPGLRFSDKFFDGCEILLCPLCNFEYLHLGKGIEIAGGDNYDAAPKMVRGSVLAIPASCENGHNLVICFGFHKGNTVVWSIIGGEGDGACPECGKDSDCMDNCSLA